MHDASGNAVGARRTGRAAPIRAMGGRAPAHAEPRAYAQHRGRGVDRRAHLLRGGPIAGRLSPSAPRMGAGRADAYNGLLLWKQPIGSWFPHLINWGAAPPQLQRKLVAVGDRVYVASATTPR